MNDAIYLAGDLSGIQRFVLGVKSAGKGQAKRLRARSFLLELFEHAALWTVQQRFQVSDEDVLIRGGGGFLVRLPPKTGSALKLLDTELQDNRMQIVLQVFDLDRQFSYTDRNGSSHQGDEALQAVVADGLLKEDPTPCPGFDDVPDANGFISLSTFQPASNDPSEGFWRVFVKYGKLAPEFHGSAVFKRPQVMLEAGACFHTSHRPEPFYGGAIGPERLLSDGARRSLAAVDVHPVQAAFALAVPMKWRNGDCP